MGHTLPKRRGESGTFFGLGWGIVHSYPPKEGRYSHSYPHSEGQNDYTSPESAAQGGGIVILSLGVRVRMTIPPRLRRVGMVFSLIYLLYIFICFYIIYIYFVYIFI